MTGRVRGTLGRLVGRLTGRPGSTGAAATTADGLLVEYTPSLDGDADPGEVVWTWVPYEDDPSQGKDRPVVVIGWAGDRLAVVPTSSRGHEDRPDADDWVSIGAGQWDREGRTSYADTGRILRVAESDVRREGATLDRPHFDRLIAALRRTNPSLA